MEQVILGFSGGVDSAVSAVLLRKAGYDVRGVFLDNGSGREDAERTAEFLKLPLNIIDVRSELEEKVCRPFEKAYREGKTPNPCILCNPVLKMQKLFECGGDSIATGHYARSENGCLYKGCAENDQSYMLCRITRPQLSKLLLPLGAFRKTEVRRMAEEFGLPVAHKPDSMEICFIPDKDYIGWLERRGVNPPGGPMWFHGRIIGTHAGIHRYTVGQRLPGLIDGRKVYVSKICAAENTIEIALWEELFKTEVDAENFHYLMDVESPFRATVRIRHTKWENPPCTVNAEGDRVHIVCDEPVRAPASGQSAVLYDGDRVIGGGFII